MSDAGTACRAMMLAMPSKRDTSTRFPGLYARHRQGCAVENDAACTCKPTFYGRAYDAAQGKQRRTATMPTLAGARAARADLFRDLEAGRTPASQSMRVKAAIEAYLAAIQFGRALNKHGRRYKPSAIRDLRGALERHVEPTLGAKRLAHVRRGDVQNLIDDLTESLSGSSVRTVVNAIRSLYAWALDRELVDHDPAQRVRLPAMDATPRDRVATVTEATTLLAALEAKDALPFAVALYAGARRNEIRHLQVGDIDLDLGVLYLGADDRARKSRAALRAVPLTRPLALMVRRRLLERGRPGPEELLCPGEKPGGRNSGLLSFEGLQTRADAAWEAASVARLTPHEGRHTFITWATAAGVPGPVVSRIAGHQLRDGRAPVTNRYSHALPGDLADARVKLDHYLAAQAKEATG